MAISYTLSAVGSDQSKPDYVKSFLSEKHFQKIKSGNLPNKLYPEFSNRKAWEEIKSKKMLKKMLDEIMSRADKVPPPEFIPHSLYREFATIGNRTNFESKNFERRRNFALLVLGMCISGDKDKYLPQRGISMYHWGWLLRDVLSYQNLHKWGCSGITGDAPGNFKRVTQSILYPIEASVVEENGTVSLAITECLYNRTTKTQSPSSVNIISGEDIVNIEGDNMTFAGSGRVTFVLGYKVSYKGYVFNLLTQPITIATANAPADTESKEDTFTPIVTTTTEPITSPDETTSTEESTSPEVSTTPEVTTDDQANNGSENDILPIIIICVAVVAAIVVVAVIAAKKKKK